MYQFSTTSVINSNLDSNGITPKFVGATDAFKVARVGKFLDSGVTSAYERAYSPAVKEVGTVTVAGTTTGEVIRLEIDIRLEGNAYSDYAVSNSQDFKKPIYVEAIATGTAATDASALADAVNKIKTTYGAYDVVATVGIDPGVDDMVITITAKNEWQRFDAIVLSEAVKDVNTIIDYVYETLATGVVTVNGVAGFGDDAYMIRSIKIPTIDNTMQWGIDSDGRPVLGGNYSQFTLNYSIPKDNIGIIAGGSSITTHVFYVISTQAAAFKTAIDLLTNTTVVTV